jgi:hypothetical protein
MDTAPAAAAEAPAAVDTPTLPRSSWFGGHLRLLAGDNIPFFERCEREFPIVKLRVYHVPVFVVSDPHLIGEVLLTQRKNFEKPRSLRMLRRLFGQGLLTATTTFGKGSRASCGRCAKSVPGLAGCCGPGARQTR